MLSGADGTLAQLLCQAKEENRMLRQEATELRCRLHDAQADTKVLREEVQRWRGGGEGRRGSQANTALTQLALQEREQFISQMEELSAKCQALEGDVRGLVEEREELVRELDATHHKLHRLNFILNTLLNSPHHPAANTTSTTNTASSSANAPVPPKRIVDLDGIITENRYLQQRLKQAEEEVTLARSNSFKYKSALERCRSQGSVKLGTSENLIVTPKQVSELLQEYRGEVGGLAESDLRSLCVALVDALGQRSRALRTQRSANRVLVNRVNELERRLIDQNSQQGNTSVGSDQRAEEAMSDLPLATQELMEGYTPPAGRGGLAWVKEEDASRDPRLSKFLGRFSSSQPPVQRETGDGGDAEAQPTGEQEYTGDRNMGSGAKRDTKENTDRTNDRENESTSEKSKDQNKTNNTNKSHKEIIREEEEEEEEEEEQEEDIPLLAADLHQPQRPTDDDLEEIVPLDQLDAYIKEMQMKRRRSAHKGKAEKRNAKNEKAETDEQTNLKEKETEAEKDVDQGIRETEVRQETNAQGKASKDERKETKEHRHEVHESSRGEAEGETTEPDEEKKDPNAKQETHDITNEEKQKANQNTTITSLEKNTKEDKEEEGDDDDDDDSIDLDLSDYDSDNDNLDLALREWKNDCGGKVGGEVSSPVRGGKREMFRLWKKEKRSSDDLELPSDLQALLDKATAAAKMEDSGWTT
ncbi:ABC transporter F family member 4-like isoform X2 [Scylla paramamosain]